jgi:DNA polymerase-3 subunit alpha
MVKHAVDNGMPALALTDHGVMYGAFEFHRECVAQGIKPLIGVELYVSTRTRHLKEAGIDGNHHLVAIAKNETGYRNLMKLVSLAQIEGFYHKPRVDKELLAQYHEGLIISSACMGGELAQTIMKGGSIEDAIDVAAWYREVFGDDFYLEIQGHEAEGQDELNKVVKRVAERTGIKLVATNDSHYTKKADARAHDILVCIQTGTNVNDPRRMRYEPQNFYLKTAQEMMAKFEKFAPEAVYNTMEIADKCNLTIETGRAPMPEIGLLPGKNADETVWELANLGLGKRLPHFTQEHQERLDYELGVIKQMGFSQYFLIVAHITHNARENRIQFGPRGSAAGSLVAYTLGITDLDPIEYELTFERFLNPERVSMPDIDMDFQDDRRGEVIQNLVDTFGQESVAFITTFGTLGAKNAVKDTGRALSFPMGEVARIADMIPKLPLGITIDKAMNGWPEKDYAGNPELREEYEQNPMAKVLLDTAKQIEGINRNESVHAAGIMISDGPLTNYTPLRRIKMKDGKESVATQYPHASLEEIGLLKMDILGLINLTIIARAVKLIEEKRGEVVDVWNIPLNPGDERADKTYAMLGRGETVGVFQLESPGMRMYITELKPTSVKELAAMVALYRPGPMAHIPKYIKGKYDPSTISYHHPSLEPVLRSTYGVLVYQDQVLRVAQSVAGMSLGQADLLRRAIGKKKQKEMEAQKEIFTQGAVNKGIPLETAVAIFDDIEPHCNYSFNGAHAACYAMVAYQTAYLKANYPAEYMAAFLSAYSEKDNTDKVILGIQECANLGVAVLPPDVNHSDVDFSADGGAVRFGLGGIKSLGIAPMQAILEARRTGLFTSLDDLCARGSEAGLRSVAALHTLLRAGALNGLTGIDRSNLQMSTHTIEKAWKKREGKEVDEEMEEIASESEEVRNVYAYKGNGVHIELARATGEKQCVSLSSMLSEFHGEGDAMVYIHAPWEDGKTTTIQTQFRMHLNQPALSMLRQCPGVEKVWVQ